jgi:hypothetical protein
VLPVDQKNSNSSRESQPLRIFFASRIFEDLNLECEVLLRCGDSSVPNIIGGKNCQILSIMILLAVFRNFECET